MTICLDSWAVLEWLHAGEPARSRVDEIFAADQPVMSWINLGEVAYRSRDRVGATGAAEIVGNLRAALALDVASPARVLEAAALKTDHGLGYADAFAVATALAYDAVLLTGDGDLIARAPCDVEDLRG